MKEYLMLNELNSLQSRHLRRAWEAVESAVAGMTEEQMNWAPKGKWSGANLIEHLSLGFSVTMKGCRMVLRQGGPELLKPTWNQRWLAFRVIELGHFPMRVIAPRMVCPRGQSAEEARRGLLANLIEMDQMMSKCEERFGRSVQMLAHPYLGPLSIPQWRKFSLFHVRRHMKQLEQLRQQMAQESLESSVSPAHISPA
jgi:hypothetical protein